MGHTKLIFLPPPFTSTYFTYQNVNADPKLRKNVTDFYFDLVPKLILSDNRFKTIKKHTKFIDSRQGYEIIYKILKRYTKKYDINWYDLRSQNEDTLDYLANKLSKVLK